LQKRYLEKLKLFKTLSGRVTLQIIPKLTSEMMKGRSSEIELEKINCQGKQIIQFVSVASMILSLI